MAYIKVPAATQVSRREYQSAADLSVTEYVFEVPKDYRNPDNGTIKLFARGVRKYEAYPASKKSLPWMLYLQGGPGVPHKSPQTSPFTRFILDKGYQLLFIDSRGTGLSTPITASTLQMRGDPEVQHRYLKLYRADSIVRDCEAVRKQLSADQPADQQRWSIMGQSFGGFCSVTYLSFYPDGLKESFIFGGLQPLIEQPDDLYRSLYRTTQERNEYYYAKFPEDVDRVKLILKFLARFGDGKIKLPSEGNLTRRRFQQLGIMIGGHGGIDRLHDIVLRASQDIEMFGHLTRPILSDIDNGTFYDDNVIFAVLHEPIYCCGQAPNWSAHRVRSEFPTFDADRQDGPVHFTAEHVYPWMFEDYSELRKLADVANRVAKDADWPKLFDVEQLKRNEVPVYAAHYTKDMYVDAALSAETAATIRGCKTFDSNVLFHDAIRTRSEEVLRQVFALKESVND